MIRLHNVTRTYASSAAPVTALGGVSLEIGAGEFVAVTGPSGCGKSTLLHLVGALDRADEGEITVDGVALHTADEATLTNYRRKQIGIVFQFFNLLPAMSVQENVSLPLLLAGVSARAAAPRALEALEQVGIAHRAGHFTHQLSGGEMQRAAIARALVHNPAVLLADEPTGNLDSANAAGVIETLRALSTQRQMTLLIVTHSEELACAASRRVRMRDGLILPDLVSV